MRTFAPATITLLVAIGSFAQDVRKVTWGQDINTVRQIEGKTPLQQNENTLSCKDKVAGYDCYLQYVFSHSGLVAAGYGFDIKHTNKNDFIDDFKKIKKVLTTKYGEPSSDDQIWKDDLYKDDEQEWGMAISVGHLNFRSAWENDRTLIVLALDGDNFEIHLNAVYYSCHVAHYLDSISLKKWDRTFS